MNKSQNRQNKEKVVNKLTDELKAAKSVSLIDFTGLNMKAQNDLKKKLKEAKAKLLVAKNTLIKISGKDAKLPSEALSESILSGQTGVVIATDDPVTPIQVVGESENIKFKAGVLDGEFQDKDAMVTISKLPSKEVLVGQTVGNIAGGMYGLINNLTAKMQELVYILSVKAG